tara:strand:+ start:1295 stop:1534 length:240 start_codon:yes stop_codon:yes gene_type:complete
MDDNENYALDNLREWVEESIDGDVTPEEFYTTIRVTILERIRYHRTCLNHAQTMLELLSNSSNHKVKRTRVGKDMDILE